MEVCRLDGIILEGLRGDVRNWPRMEEADLSRTGPLPKEEQCHATLHPALTLTHGRPVSTASNHEARVRRACARIRDAKCGEP